MKIQRTNIPDSGAACKSYKPSKKSKGTKKSPEKVLKNANSSDSQESLPKQIAANHILKKPLNKDKPSLRKLPEVKPQSEKRKPEITERKILKKVDRQRLETVLEEGYISSDEVLPTHNFPELLKCDSISDGVRDAPSIKNYRSWIQSLVSFSETSTGALKVDDNLKKSKEESQFDQIDKTQISCEKETVFDLPELPNEPKQSYSRELSPSKRGVILSGMMEILPIFSNDRFYCSRDALSLEDTEDIDIEKNVSRFILDMKKDSRPVEVKPLPLAASTKKEEEFDDKYIDILADVKNTPEKKAHHKVTTEKSVGQQTSSPFINSLMALSPFVNEKENNNEKKVKPDVPKTTFCVSETFSTYITEDGKYWLSLKIVFGLVMSFVCLLMTVMSVAWMTYKPPCLVDSLLEVLPFVHYRRSYFHIFFDKLIIFFSTLGDQCVKFSKCDHNFEFNSFKFDRF